MRANGSFLKAIGAAYFLLSLTACMNQGGALEILVCGGDEHAEDHAHEDGETHLHEEEGGRVPCSGDAHTEKTAGTGDAHDEHDESTTGSTTTQPTGEEDHDDHTP